MIIGIGIRPLFYVRLKIERTKDGAFAHLSIHILKLGIYFAISARD